MPNFIAVVVEGSADLLNAGAYGAGAVVAIQSAATETGAYAAISGTGSTPSIAIVSGTGSYTGYDPGGIDSTWYRTRYESAGGVRVSDWTTAFQVGDETAGLLCSLYDVQQELGGTQSANDNENILEKIRQVSAAIEFYIGRWMAPRPADQNSTTTLNFDVPWTRWAYPLRTLLLDYGNRLTGIRSIATIAIATVSQPETGGTYTTGTVADFLLRPRPSTDGPALRLEITPYPTGTPNLFYPGYNTVQITGSFGPSSTPYDLQGVAVRATVRRFIGKGGGGVAVATGPNGTEIMLPDMSGADRVTLDRYRIPVVG